MSIDPADEAGRPDEPVHDALVPVAPAADDEAANETLAEPGEPGVHALDVRRAPRVGRFIAVGVIAGACLGMLANFLADGTTYRLAVAVFLAIGGAVLGGLAAAVWALAADRRSRVRN